MRYALTFMLLVTVQRTMAQAIDPQTQELIQKLLSRVDTLEKRIAELEKGTGPTPNSRASGA
jgi:hypothetical protein